MFRSGHMLFLLALLVLLSGCVDAQKKAREHYLQGQAYEKEGKIQKAIDEYFSALKIKSSYIQAHRSYQRLMLQKGRKKDLLDYYEKAARENPRNPAFHYLYGCLLENPADRIEAYEKALTPDPNYIWAIDALGVEFMKQGKTDEALKKFNKVLEIDSEFAPVHINLCRVLREKGKTDAALSEINKYLQLEPESSEGYEQLGLVYQAKGDSEKALQSWQKSAELDSRNLRPLLDSASLLITMKDYDRALQSLEKARTLSPDNGEMHYLTALIYDNQKKTDDALKEIQAALEKEPANPSYMLLFGDISIDRGDYKSAKECFEKLLLKNAHNPRILVYLATIYEQEGSLDKAISAYEGALSFNPRLIDARRSLASLLLARGNAKEALKEYQNLLSSKRGNISDHMNMGLALMLKKDIRRALAEFKTFLQKDPRNRELPVRLYCTAVTKNCMTECAQVMNGLAKAGTLGPVYTAFSLATAKNYKKLAEMSSKELSGKKAEPLFHITAALASEGKRDYAEGLAHLENASTSLPESDQLARDYALCLSAHLYGQTGEVEKGIEILSESGTKPQDRLITALSCYEKARLNALSGKEVREALLQAIEEGFKNAPLIEKDDAFSSLVKEKDFNELKSLMR